jgi:hypothetical protein
MPLRKATQAVIAPNICTTDTDQTITGNKIFSNPIQGNVDGILTGNVIGSASLNVLKTGDTMTGALNVPAGATGSQVPRISEVVAKTGDTMTGGLLVSTNTSSDALRVTQTGTGAALRVEDSVNPDASPFIITNLGSVGIGTSSPTQKLDVSGSVNVSSSLTADTVQANAGGTFGGTAFSSQVGIIATPNSLANIVTFNGAIGNKSITAITQDPSIETIFYLTSTAHALQDYDFITFSGETGSNQIFNGTFPIRLDLVDPVNKFWIQVATLPTAALTQTMTGRIVREYGRGYGDYVSSITKNAQGDFTINFSATMADTNYLVFGSASNPSSTNVAYSTAVRGIVVPWFFDTAFLRVATVLSSTGAVSDYSRISVGIVPNN